MTKHTQGPWRITHGMSEGYIAQDGGGYVEIKTPFREDAFTDSLSRSSGLAAQAEANAARIVACVNACEGINPEAVPEIVSVLRDLVALIRAARPLKMRCNPATAKGYAPNDFPAFERACAALAKARGQE